jgi:hypothetical protein
LPKQSLDFQRIASLRSARKDTIKISLTEYKSVWGRRSTRYLPSPNGLFVCPTKMAGPERTLDSGMHTPTVRERLSSGILTGLSCSSVLSTAETNIGVPIGWIVPVALGAPQIVCIIVPRPATQHPLLRARTGATFVVAPSDAKFWPLKGQLRTFFPKNFRPRFAG